MRICNESALGIEPLSESTLQTALIQVSRDTLQSGLTEVRPG